MTQLSKGSVVLLGTAVGIPVDNYALVHGVVQEVDGNTLSVLVGDKIGWIAGEPTEVCCTWNGKTLNEMSPEERAHCHTLWVNYWVPLHAQYSDKWIELNKRENVPFKDFPWDTPIRMVDSQAVEYRKNLEARYVELQNAAQHELKVYEDAKRNHMKLMQELNQISAELY